jgi:hypothetical protein
MLHQIVRLQSPQGLVLRFRLNLSGAKVFSMRRHITPINV